MTADHRPPRGPSDRAEGTPAPSRKIQGGLFVSVEGLDGAGKSTQLRRLAARLRDAGHDPVETREPGGTAGAEEIRALLKGGAAARWSPECEIVLFTAARRDHWDKVIGPALAAGRIVLCDRFADSTRVYQGTTPARREMVEALHSLLIGRDPDLTLLLDVPPAAARARMAQRGGGGDRLEARSDAALTARTEAFRALQAAEPGRIRTIAADASQDVVADRIWAEVSPLIAPEAAEHG